MTAHLGAAPYERTEGRTGYRNGHKPRTLKTRVGTLKLRVPQDRDGTFSTELFARYQRNEQALVLALMEMYVQGVSTRKVTAITEELCGTGFSKSQVSALAGRLDAELAAWRSRPLEAAYPYLFVDARYEHARVDGRVVSQGVLVVAAVRDDGGREILAVEVADTESEATYQELFRALKERGLRAWSWSPATTTRACGRRSRGTSRGRAGSAARSTSRATCWGWSAASTGRWRRDLRASSRRRREQARADRPRVAEQWRRRPPGVAGHGGADRGLPRLLRLPRRHRRRIRTTNGLERLNQELKRRTRVVRIFPNREPAAAGDGAGDGAERGVGQGPALPGHEGAQRAPSCGALSRKR